MERLQEEYKLFKKAQLEISDKGAPQKFQQSFFINPLFSSEKSDRTYQATAQAFAIARSEIITLFLDHACIHDQGELSYTVSIPDRNLPFYLYYLNNEHTDINKQILAENTAKLTFQIRPELGDATKPVLIEATIEKHFARGNIIFHGDYTSIYLPYHPYRGVQESKIREDARSFTRSVQELAGKKPDTIKKTTTIFPVAHEDDL